MDAAQEIIQNAHLVNDIVKDALRAMPAASVKS